MSSAQDPIYFYTKNDPFCELSNFAPFGFEYDGVYWPTVEHFFQAQKFLDPEHRERIRRASSPRDARALGQSRAIPIRADWEAVREDVMYQALRLKFRRSSRSCLAPAPGRWWRLHHSITSGVPARMAPGKIGLVTCWSDCARN